MNDRLDRHTDRADRRPAPRDQRVEQILAEHGLAPRPVSTTLRGPMHAKGGWQLLCVTGDIAFANRIAHTADAIDAHAAVAWTLEDMERLPIWAFHALVIDQALHRDLTARGSPRVRKMLAELPVSVTTTEDADAALRSMIANLTSAASGLNP